MSFWVAKFGGSSISDAESFRRCAQIVKNNPEIGLVVVSATFQTTHQLEKKSFPLLQSLTEHHLQMGKDLGASTQEMEALEKLGQEAKTILLELEEGRYAGWERASIQDTLLSVGERWSSLLFSMALSQYFPKEKIQLKDARSFIKTDSKFGRANIEWEQTEQYCKLLLRSALRESLIVTQGFIGSNEKGHTTTLGKEGSDYTATLLGAILRASKIQIWTDVPGIFSSDPKIVPSARVIRHLNYEEASLMAQLGARVLFSKTLDPLKHSHLSPVLFVASSKKPAEGGTVISDTPSLKGLKAICLKEYTKEEMLLSMIGRGEEWENFKGEGLEEVERGPLYRSFLISSQEAILTLRAWHAQFFETKQTRRAITL